MVSSKFGAEMQGFRFRGWSSLLAVAAVFLALIGCNGGEDAPVPVEESTYRVGVPEVSAGSEVNLHIFRDRDACIAGLVNDLDKCERTAFTAASSTSKTSRARLRWVTIGLLSVGVGTEDFHEAADPLEFLDGVGDFFVLEVAVAVDEK